MTDKEKVYALLSMIDEQCQSSRDCYGNDCVCGLCEWDGSTIEECPGVEVDECFRMSERFVAKYLDEPDYTAWYQERYGDDGKEGR